MTEVAQGQQGEGSGSNARKVVRVDGDYTAGTLDACLSIKANANLTLPQNPFSGETHQILTDGGIATVLGGANVILGGNFVLPDQSEASVSFTAEGRWIKCICGGPTGPSGPSGPTGVGPAGPTGPSTLLQSKFGHLAESQIIPAFTLVAVASVAITTTVGILEILGTFSFTKNVIGDTRAVFQLWIDGVPVAAAAASVKGGAIGGSASGAVVFRTTVAPGIHVILLRVNADNSITINPADVGGEENASLYVQEMTV